LSPDVTYPFVASRAAALSGNRAPPIAWNPRAILVSSTALMEKQ
jgi:hypothetical protein